MRIISEETLKKFRGVRCEYCNGFWGVVGHHIRTRATGRLDVPANLVSLCVPCHTKHHNGGHPTTDECWVLVGSRSGMHPEECMYLVDYLRRVPAGLYRPDKDEVAQRKTGHKDQAEVGAVRGLPLEGRRLDRPPSLPANETEWREC